MKYLEPLLGRFLSTLSLCRTGVGLGHGPLSRNIRERSGSDASIACDLSKTLLRLLVWQVRTSRREERAQPG